MINTANTMRSAMLSANPTGFPGMLDGESAQNGDPFAMLLGQLMTGQKSDMSLLLNGELAESRWPEEDNEGFNRAAAMLAEMLAAGGPAAANLLQDSLNEAQREQQGQTALPGLAQAPVSSPEQLLTTLWAGANGRREQTAGTQWSDGPVAARDFLIPGQGGETTRSTVDGTLFSVNQASAKSDPTSAEDLLMGGRSRFTSSVFEAQKLLTQEADRKQREIGETVPDVEHLQKAVDNGTFASRLAGSERALEQPVDGKDVLNQVATGLEKNLPLEKGEFVIKLKPDGLGEITVRLTEADGKIALNILTTSTQVTKLLGQELSALQQSLRPYHAEVQTITTVPTAAETASYHGMNSEFGGHQHQQAFEQQREQTAWTDEDDESHSQPAWGVENAAVSSALDTYI